MSQIDNIQRRLIILYSFHKIGKRISREQIAPLILNTTSLNWFDTQRTITSLIKDRLLVEDPKTGEIGIGLEGERVVKVTKKDIKKSQKEKIDNYILKHKSELLNELEYLANFEKHESGYIVHLELRENNIMMMDLYLTFPSRELAEEVCSEWKNNCITVYKDLIRSISKKRT